MLHRGKVVLDVKDKNREELTVPDLLALFKRTSGEDADDDALVLG
ncbi:MAG: ABC transporter ATP-binding protein, partial [Alphaproteobacteria bacterium]|nr:ABC transporter ATP-binding protein [Alphaproteobacteria bacterium]